MTTLDQLRAKALIWRDLPPSGKCIMHTIPRKHWCPRHGRVTSIHICPVTHPAFFGPPSVAQSAWMKKEVRNG